MKYSYVLGLIISLVLCASVDYSTAQQTEVTGVVTAASDGASLPGVNIAIKGTNRGTSTNMQGEFTLRVPSLQDTLVFSYIGYQTREIPINDRTRLNVALRSQAITGEEMVVVGYGEQERQDVTGSVSSVRPEQFKVGANTSVDQLIMGKVPGVRVVENSGEPGGGLSINIRGAGSVNAGTGPLYVIDGMPIENQSAQAGTGAGFVGSRSGRSEISSLNPSDIQSIEILKDASATAIYGARGANGVVLITTKKGDRGQMQVNYDGYMGIQNPARELDLLSTQEYVQVNNELVEARGLPDDQKITSDEIANGGAGTDWRKEVYNDNAFMHDNNLSFSGGSDDTRYYASLNFMEQEGLVQSSKFEKYSGRVNIDQQTSDKFNWSINLSANYAKDDYAPTGYGLNENAGALYTAMNWDPTKPVYNNDGTFFESNDLTMENPVALVNGEESIRSTYRYFGTMNASYDVLPQFTLKANIGGDVKSQRRDTYISRLTQSGRAFGGIASISEGQATNYLLETTAHYRESFDKHEFDAMVGATTQEFITIRDYQEAMGFANDATRTNNMSLGDQETFDMNSTKFGYTLISYIGRVNYQYDNTYLFTGTFRADGSSKFGENNKYGYFPSFALGWRMTEEPFLEDVDALSNLKLRFSWGETGNQEIGNFLSLTTFGPGGTPIWDNSPVVGLAPERLANPNIQWETTRQWNVGLDFGLFNQRITGSAEYYEKDTYDMLLDMPIPNETGFQSQIRNVGSIFNSGFELSLNTRNISKRDFTWTTSLNFSTLQNEVEDLGGIEEIITGNVGFTNGFFLIREGVPLRSFYGYEIQGIWQEDDDLTNAPANVEPGMFKYKDQVTVDTDGDGVPDAKDGVINADDRVVLGNSFPDYTFSIGNTFSYQSFTLDIFIEGAQGVDMLNGNLIDTYFPVQFRRNKLAEPYLNRWTPDNPTNKYPSFVDPLAQGQRAVNSRTVQDASYLRLKTVKLSYSVPAATLGNLMRKATIYVTGENLYTLTDYTGLDPALNSNGNANARIDYNSYPLGRTFMAGIQLGF